MRVAISGARGFVGRRTVKDLGAAGFDVVPLVRRSGGTDDEIAVGDLAEIAPTLALPAIDACLHLAGRAHKLNDAAEDPLAAYRSTNVEGTRRLLDAVIRAGCRHFVYVSSVKAAGERSTAGPLHPDDPMHPEDPYGVSKAEAEILVRETCDAAGIGWTILRPPLVYGPGVAANFHRLLRLALSGLPLPLGAATNRRSMVFVGNLADAMRAVLTTPESRGRTFYVTDGEDVSTADLIRRIARAGGKRAWLLPVPRTLLALPARLVGKGGEFRRLFDDLQVDARPLREALHWTPPYSVDQALQLTVGGLQGQGGGVGPAGQ
ncbi:NAD-dependent epimerase/dehydratase family protein [Brevundimonas sp. LjRoot202]|uniref:NAD-dependent epimerase/dehydratase family protein n=1 Tax=Brevundimonas sp. LjRoot202 TaxID=3342281 RepID=UPI003ED02673